MKYVLHLLIFGILCGCAPIAAPSPLRVAYLVLPGGQLSPTDLAQHPEILVTGNFDEFKQAANHRIGLWFDKDATQLVERGWLDQMPQASYPMIVVGYNDTLLSFKYSLFICCFFGPANPDFSGAEPGFSVIERASGAPFAPVIMAGGFKQIPTVDAILKISNDLLDGKIKPTPRFVPPNIPTNTPPPFPQNGAP